MGCGNIGLSEYGLWEYRVVGVYPYCYSVMSYGRKGRGALVERLTASPVIHASRSGHFSVPGAYVENSYNHGD